MQTGGIVSVAIDEEGLTEYAQLFEEIQSLDGLMEHMVRNSTIPYDVLDTCDISSYITSTSKYIITFQ